MTNRKQWRVTSWGLESISPRTNSNYWIEAEWLDRITTRSEDPLYDWPLHMAEKSWVDIEDFIAAFRQALIRHAKKIRPIDPDILEASFGAARLEARMTDEYRKANSHLDGIYSLDDFVEPVIRNH